VPEEFITVDANTWDAEVLFALLSGRFDSFEVPLKGRIQRAIRAMIRDQFTTQGGFSGGWAHLSPSTLRAKALRGTLGKGILRDSDRLYNSVAKTRGITADTILEIQKYSLRYGTNVPYAIYHQLGTIRMPRRPIVPDTTPQSVVDEIDEALADWIITGGGA
jgi:phage gpG-like protein